MQYKASTKRHGKNAKALPPARSASKTSVSPKPETKLENGKDDYLPKIRVQSWRKSQWQSAWRIAQRDNPDMSFIDWVRSACDEKAASAMQSDKPRPPGR